MNIRTWVGMPLQWSFRGKCLAGFGACAGVLLYALYVQFFDRLNPCPLCTFQRGAFVLLGLVFLGGALAGPKSRAGRIIVAGWQCRRRQVVSPSPPRATCGFRVCCRTKCPPAGPIYPAIQRTREKREATS